MRAGFGKWELTPPMGVELAGYGYYLGRCALSVQDPLYARAVMLEEGGLRCADLSEESRENIRFVKDDRNIRIPCSRYTGFGVITDKAKLLSLLADGLGKNKCYGAGLMFAMPATASLTLAGACAPA